MVPVITSSALIALVVGEADMIDRGKAAMSRITAYASPVRCCRVERSGSPNRCFASYTPQYAALQQLWWIAIAALE